MQSLAAFISIALPLLQPQGAGDFVPGEVLVKFRESTPVFTAAASLGVNARVVHTLPRIDVHRIRLSHRTTVREAVAYFRTLPYVEFAEPNYVVRAFEVPNDAMFSQQWNMTRISCVPGWDLSHGSSAVVIAIVDTGVDLNHPDLRDKLVPGIDIKNNDSIPMDDHGHGSHVAGIAAASTNNGIGVAGVGYACRLMPIKVLGSNGNGSMSDAAEGIVYAVSHGAKVVSLSLGTNQSSPTLSLAVAHAFDSGVLVVAAAGNQGTNAKNYPAAYENAIAVGATDENDAKAGFSNFGFWVDVAAPGVEILSAYRNGEYRHVSGTSMATPHVAGLAALLWSELGVTTDVSIIRDRIEGNAVSVGNWLAHGRIDVQRALLDSANSPPVRRVAPLVSHTVLAGQVLRGSFGSLLASDEDRLDLGSVRVGSGRRVQYFVSATPDWAGQKIGIEVSLEGSAAPTAVVTVSLWNWGAARWDGIGATALGLGDRLFRFRTLTADPYIGPKGEVRALFSRIEPRNRLFWIRTDKVELASLSSE